MYEFSMDFCPNWAPLDENCANDDTTADVYGDTCTSWYDFYPGDCGWYDDDDFDSVSQCCMCGGGCTGDDCSATTDDSTDDSTDDDSCTNDMRFVDVYGDSCLYYDTYPSECGGFYDTDDFHSDEQCCACGGTGCDEGDDCSRVTEDSEEEVITWENCENNLNTTDSWGDNCTFYDTSPISCGYYDDSDFVASEMCCACKNNGAAEEEENESGCTNVDTSADLYGDTCSTWYDYYPSSCGFYDDDDFVSGD